MSSSANRQAWIYFGLRWLFILSASVALYVAQIRTLSDSDFLLCVGIAIAANLLVGACILIPQLAWALPVVGIPTDWIISGLFAYLAYPQPVFILGIAGLIALSGVLYYGAEVGIIQAIGALVAVLAGVTVGLGGFEAFTSQINQYLPTIIWVISFIITVSLWIYFFNEDRQLRGKGLVNTVKSQEEQINAMRERVRAISEVAVTLNLTLHYETILDTVMSVGETLRRSPKHRLVSIAMLFTPMENLEIATARGLKYQDEGRVIPGKSGIIAEALAEGGPVITTDGGNDPELSQFIAFRNIRSTLVIPLRSGYDNYGVLIYGSEGENDFTDDHIDMLKSIGTQVTVALQNAVLYRNLMEERDRIIRLQEAARKELVRDLHDIPTQTMSVVAMRLSSIPKIIQKRPEAALEEVEEIRQIALRATEEIRHVMFKLRPLTLESQGLKVALEQLASETLKTHKQNVEVDVDEQVENYLDVSQQGTLFQLIDEAVGNARKHAGAPVIRIVVKLDTERNMIIARVMDNGKGFDVDKAGGEVGHFGMTNLKDRAQLLNGMLDIKSSIGRGTVISVAIPLAPDKRPIEPVTKAKRPRTKLVQAALERFKASTP